jgi:hypothetical protein
MMLRRLAPLVLVALLALAPAAVAAKKKTVKLAPKGATTLALSDGAAAALQSLNISAAPLKPARAGAKGIAFPITAGRLDAKTYAGKIKHSGGLSLTRGATRVDLRNFTINVDGAPDLTARVGDARVSVLDLDLTDAKIAASGRKVTIAGVKATLTGDAADALNAAFGTTAFQKGLELGTATVSGRVAKRN